MGLGDVGQISRIVIDPTNPDIVFVAAIGHAWTPNADRGVFRTADGGKSWQKVLFVSDGNYLEPAWEYIHDRTDGRS